MNDLADVVLVGVGVGVCTGVPLIWLSWKIPQQIFGGLSAGRLVVWSDPAIRALHWEDAVLIVLLCLSAMGVVAYRGLELNAMVSFYYCAVLLLLARIDVRTHLLPDVLTLSLLWSGLLWHTANMGELSLEQSIWGAAAGYIILWVPCAILSRCCGREMMGHGDFKLSAAIGAWLGLLTLPFVWLIASVSSLILALFANRFIGRRLRAPMPFGPGLALGGILMLFFDWL